MKSNRRKINWFRSDNSGTSNHGYWGHEKVVFRQTNQNNFWFLKPMPTVEQNKLKGQVSKRNISHNPHFTLANKWFLFDNGKSTQIIAIFRCSFSSSSSSVQISVFRNSWSYRIGVIKIFCPTLDVWRSRMRPSSAQIFGALRSRAVYLKNNV